jgi:signal transduction histidine kinase
MNYFQNRAYARPCHTAPGLMYCAARALGSRFLIAALSVTTISSAHAQDPALPTTSPILLTNIQQALALGNAVFQTNPRPVRLRGVLTASVPDDRVLYLQDGEFALSAEVREPVESYTPGQLLEVEGVAVASRVQPRIQVENVRVIRISRLPAYKRGDVYKMAAGEDAFRYINIRGVVRDLLWENNRLVHLVRHGGLHFRAVAPAPPGTRLPRELIDAEIDVRGVCVHAVDAQGATRGFNLIMPGTNSFKLLLPGTTNLFDRPLTTIAEFHSRRVDQIMRTRIAGTVLAHFPDQVLFLQDETGAARVDLVPLLPRTTASAVGLEHEPQTYLEPGERVELIAIRYNDQSSRTFLYDGEYRRIGRAPPPTAKPTTPIELRTGTNAHRLVTLKATIVGNRTVSGPGTMQQDWQLEADGRTFQARLDGVKLPEDMFPPQSWILVTGVHEVIGHEWPERTRPTLRLRNAADLVLAAAPPFWARPEYRRLLPVGITGGVGVIALLLLQRWQMRRLERRVADRTADLSSANERLKEEVTARGRAETEVQRALAQEKELSELKSRFVSMVSHEFRTPLAIITSSAEILDSYLDRLSPEDRKSNLRDITDATRHMSRMMEEVLLLGRVEAGKMICRPGPLDLTAFGERLVDEVTSATNRRCPIEFTAAPGLVEAQADEGLLRHIFTNLLNNASKYSLPGSLVEFQVEARGHLALFTVRDRGIGIPEADARLLFQAFHRGRNVGDTPGTGLGMTIVKRCVELHEGRIAFESKEGHGTAFIVALPLFGALTSGNRDQTTQIIRAAASGRALTLIP